MMLRSRIASMFAASAIVLGLPPNLLHLSSANPACGDPLDQGAVQIPLQNGTATFSQLDDPWTPAEAVDGQFTDMDGWAIGGTFPGPLAQTAVWETGVDVSSGVLTFTMYFLHNNPGHLLGRFRFSVTTDDRSAFADGLFTGGDVDADWIVLANPEVTGPAGMTFTTLEDQSVLAGGDIPATGSYQICYSTTLSGITGVRLEALKDPSLPLGGPGLFPPNGNFVLTEILLEHAVSTFASFALDRFDLNSGPSADRTDSYHLAGTFALSPDSDGARLLAEDLVITVGPSTITVPAGSMSKQGNVYTGRANADGVLMTVRFEDRGTGAFGFEIEASSLDLSGLSNPVRVQLLVGNDRGQSIQRLSGLLHLGQPPDTTPPQIVVAAKPIVLWPPDHGYRRIQVTDFVLSVTDAVDKTVSVRDVAITRVTSDEGDDADGGGDGETVHDIVIGETGRWVDLRAERQGGGNGRVYTIQVAATDASGNTGTTTFDVQVPHDAKRAAIKDDVLGAVAFAPAGTPGSLAGTGLTGTSGAAPTLAGELQLDSRGVFIRWRSAEGQAYRLEYKETLTDPDWVPVGVDLLGTGGVMAVRVPTTVHPQRFYRLRVVD